VTNSERRVQRVRKALEPPGEAREELWVLSEIAKRLGTDWGYPKAEEIWEEVRALGGEMFGGMSYERLETMNGIQWPCPTEDHPGTMFCHARLWESGEAQGMKAPFHAVKHELPLETPDAEYPLTLTTGRRLSDYNTGVQTSGFDSPLRRSESIDMFPADAARYGFEENEVVRISSRRGSIVAPIHIDPALKAGIVFMTFHFGDEYSVNRLTINATDEKAGTAEFKACAVKLEAVVPRHDAAKSAALEVPRETAAVGD